MAIESLSMLKENSLWRSLAKQKFVSPLIQKDAHDNDDDWGMDVDDEEFEELNPDFLLGVEEE